MAGSSCSQPVDTVIVGAGIAGLACARALHTAGHDFLLVSDRLGGRLHTSPDGHPLGAAYCTSDYRHVRPFVERGPRFWKKNVCFWDGRRFVTLVSPRNFVRLPALGRLIGRLMEFRSHFNAMRRHMPYVCQKELLEADPFLQRTVQQPATDFVREHRLEEINDLFAAPAFYSTLFVPWNEANAFYWLANLFPVLLSTYPLDLRHTVARLTDGYADRIHQAKVTSIVAAQDGRTYEVRAGEAAWTAQHLVLAIPGRNVAGLVDVEHTARNVPFVTLHVRGRRRLDFAPGKVVFLRAEHPVRVLWPQGDGVDILYSAEPEPDLSPYYDGYDVVARAVWRTAVQLSGDTWRPLQPRPNLFTIGDHNVVGLEDSYLTGLFAANRILGRREA